MTQFTTKLQNCLATKPPDPGQVEGPSLEENRSGAEAAVQSLFERLDAVAGELAALTDAMKPLLPSEPSGNEPQPGYQLRGKSELTQGLWRAVYIVDEISRRIAAIRMEVEL